MASKKVLATSAVLMASAALQGGQQALAAGHADFGDRVTSVPGGAGSASNIDPAAVTALLESVKAALAALAPDAAQQDIEAAIVFTVDQSQQPPEVILAALAELQAVKPQSAITRKAVASVLQARRRLAGQGTGSLADDGAIFGAGEGPAVVLAGGSSNYTG
jgi:hypothetical protein